MQDVNELELTTVDAINLNLKLCPVYADIPVPLAKAVLVRQVRRFSQYKALRGIPVSDPTWKELTILGNTKGIEVKTLEGWRVPERVYIKERKKS